MHKILSFFLGLTLLMPLVASASILGVQQGGTASSSLTGILVGNGISPINTLTIGTNLTLTGSTLNATGGQPFPTSTNPLMATYFVATGTTATSSFNGRTTHFGPVSCGTGGILNNSLEGTEYCGNDNTDAGGVQIIESNGNAGPFAWGGITLNNDQADASFLHFAGIYYNSSTYTSSFFGGLFAWPSLMVMQNTDGPIRIIMSTSTVAKNFFEVAPGGTGTSSIMFHVDTNGVGVATTTPGSILSIGTSPNQVANFRVGTSSVYGGLNITAGCFAINNVCVTGGGGGGSSINTNPLSVGYILASSTATSTYSGGLEANGIGAPWFSATSTTATSTFQGGVSILNFNQTGTATSTHKTGLTIASGCYAVLNVCVGLNNLSGQITLTTQVTGVLPVANGGTGDNTLSGGQVLYGNATGAIGSVATGTITGSGGVTATANQYIIGSGLTIGCTAAGTGSTGCLSSTDWNTFNNKISWGAATSTSANQIVYTNNNGLLVSAASSSLSLPNTALQNSTISNVALGGTLNSLSKSGTTLNGTSYNGSATVSDWAINLANANIWTGGISGSYTATTTFAAGLEATKIGAQFFFATSTTASSTFAGGVIDGAIKSCASPSALQTDSAGGIICAAVTATVTGPNSSIATFNNSGNLIGSSTPSAASYLATSTTATSTFAGNVMIGTSANSANLPLQTPFMVSGSVSGFLQQLLVNTNSGNSASGDYVIGTNKDTSGNTYFGEFGVNGGGYTLAADNSENALDTFLTSNDASVVIGAASTTGAISDIRFDTAGLASSSERMIIQKNGNVGIASTTPGTILGVNGAGDFTGTVTAPTFNATNTAATSTFSGGFIVANGGIQNQAIKSCLSPNALQGDASGNITCGAISATVTGPNSSLAAFNNSGTMIGTSTINIASLFATTTTATSTFLGIVVISTTSPQAFAVTDGNYPNTTPTFSIQTATTSPFASGDIFDITNYAGLNFFAFTKNEQFLQGTTSSGRIFNAIHEYANSPVDYTTLFAVASSSASATTTLFSIDNQMHQYSASTSPPTLSSCGTAPQINGSDEEGTVIPPGSQGTCNITFNQPWFNANSVHCVVTPRTGSITNSFNYAVTATTLNVTDTAVPTFDYICRGTKAQ